MKFFLSSTYLDLKEVRQVAINMLKSLIGDIVAMEFFDANEASSSDVCLSKVRESDLVIGIYGNRYGSIVSNDSDRRSMTEIEFDEANKCGIPILRFIANTVESEAEDQQKRFIENKVLVSEALCAHFDLNDLSNFAERLNGSLKTYFGGLDGYEYHSVWDDIIELKTKMISDDSFPHLIPYADNEALAAIDEIEKSSKYLSAVIDDLISENDMVHQLAYDYRNVCPDGIKENEQNTLDKISQNPDLILRNWEVVNMLLPNNIKNIQLSVYYLKLCFIQNKLTKELWREELRQEILSVKREYLNFITNESMLVD